MAPRPLLLMPLFLPNVEVAFRGWMGGAIYVQNLATVLSQLPAEERPRIAILTDGGLDAALPRTLYNLAAVEGIFEPTGKALAIKPALAPEILNAAGEPDPARINAFFGTATTIFPVLRSMFEPDKALHWIPDFQHHYLPEMFDAEEIRNRNNEFRIMTHSRKFVLVSSEAGRSDLAKFYPTATAKTYIWHFASSLDGSTVATADPRSQFSLTEKFLFAPNQFWKHKDHLTLFRAIALLRDRGVEATVACTGRAIDMRNPEYMDTLKAFIADNKLEDRIKLLGVVPPDVLVNLFRHAAAVVQPSLFEGWSTVVEDTKALGRPIFLTDLPVHREQVADAGPMGAFHFFPPGDASSLADAIAAAWPRLAPGPNPAKEAAAEAARRVRARASAATFVAIVTDMAKG
jgi:glycosyltransferase involved in cell wall biosynthesis